MRSHQESPDRVEYSTSPGRDRRVAGDSRAGAGWAVVITLGALGAFGVVALLAFPSSVPAGDEGTSLGTVLIFGCALAGWISKRVDDTVVALAAAVGMVLLGSLHPGELLAALVSEPIWLVAAAFVLAAGVNATALPTRLTLTLLARARSARDLVHLITAALVLTALLVPSTSGRAALVLPLHRALAATFPQRTRLVRALAVLFPTVVLLSAVATLIGAGAHLITDQVLAESTGVEIGFLQWLACGLPLAVASSHLAAELVLLLFTDRDDRRTGLRVDPAEMRARTRTPSRPQRAEIRVAVLLGFVIALWSTEPLHGLPPAPVAVAGAALITAPRVGTVGLRSAISRIPWSLLLFMAATTAMAGALVRSGAADRVLAGLLDTTAGDAPALVAVVVLLSIAAHLLIQSRSARSSVLIPLVVPAALATGVNPVSLAFISTAAAGFCHTLPSSAKPVAMFTRIDDASACEPRDLLKLSVLLGPAFAGVVLLFACAVWPLLGLPLF